MENKLTPELLEKAKLTKSPEELITLAKEIGAEMTLEEANTYFAMLNPKTGELADDELEDVAGGRKCGTIYKNNQPVVTHGNSCEYWRNEKNGLIGSETGESGTCSSCWHFKCDGWVYYCSCSARYNN